MSIQRSSIERLSGTVVVVTGGASGIGKAIVERLSSEGAFVVSGDRSVGGQESESMVSVTCDLSSESGAAKLIGTAIAKFDRIDVLVNNVGTFPIRDGFLATSRSEWTQLLDLNFFSMVECCRLAIPHMKRAGGGSLIHIGSDQAVQPDPILVDYAVGKAAMVNLSKSLALEFGKDGIRSNVVSPGPTMTPEWTRPGGFADGLAAEYQMSTRDAIEHYAREVRSLPLGRMLRPEDTAAVVAFLASEDGQSVTGSDWCVDGGARKSV